MDRKQIHRRLAEQGARLLMPTYKPTELRVTVVLHVNTATIICRTPWNYRHVFRAVRFDTFSGDILGWQS